MSNLDLHDLLNEVNDFPTFLTFVSALAADRADSVEQEKASPSSPYGPEANGWENTSIEQYLECAVAWAQDAVVGRSPGLVEPSLQDFANFLLAAKNYELPKRTYAQDLQQPRHNLSQCTRVEYFQPTPEKSQGRPSPADVPRVQ
jgi:hypothetical protein